MDLFQQFIFEDGIVVEGLTKELSIFYVLECFKKTNRSIVVLTSNMYEANLFYRLLLTYTDLVLLFPMDDFFTNAAIAVSPELKIKRLETLEKINSNQKYIVVTNLMGYLKYLPGKQEAAHLKLSLNKGLHISRDALVEALEKLGYHRDSMVTSTGEYAVRGFIIDVFLNGEEHPIRIEFFGDEIESIRIFDEESQLTLTPITSIECNAIDEVETSEVSSLLDYLEKPVLISIDHNQIEASYHKLLEEISAYKNENAEMKTQFFLMEDLHPSMSISINQLVHSLNKKVLKFHTQEIENFRGNFDLLKDKTLQFVREGKTVVFCLSRSHQAKMIADLFDRDVHFSRKQDILENKINLLSQKMNHGFIWDSYVVISEFDIEEIKQEIKYKNTLKIGKKLKDLDSLKIGDYVVHLAHGIGIYSGVVTLNMRGLQKDYIQILYAGNDKVYIPVEKISSIYKYSDADGSKPQISKLGTSTWQKKKQQVQKKIHDISKELIELYAKRSQIKGEAYIDYPDEEVFASQFDYEETRDQKRAIADVVRDLDSEIPMDRSLCGDVGFGKTEVAFRAMFKTLCNNKQVLYLCPTTILSKQQYESACHRFQEYPIEIALLNRFTTPKETKRIIEGLKNGTIDMVFGTHRLLSKDISFKKLGLLIVDEEQRFGVTHKERIKEFKNDVNVLTLSATPIPRTLKMALSGLRDLSIIDTPPVNRYPVQTYVISESDVLIKDAIYKELARDGQCFILYNYIDTIEEKMNSLKRLVPEARIAYAHGKMDKESLDQIMEEFVNHEFDILLSTTIIETGIDIANANTLIIYDADRFGLSQLYQLRGRVGRSNKIAYAYLLYQKNKMLNDIAVKRLQAISDFTELGSGYKIAMRDLSIRGAGDLLGSEQAGFVDSVGISLYMKMIEEEMKRLKGEEVIHDDEKEPLIKVATHIEDSYVSDEDIKIEIHHKINEIDSYDALIRVREELEDRFGKISSDMEVYMYEEWFEKLAEKLHISDVVQNERLLKFSLGEEESSKIKGDKLFLEAYNINPKFQLSYMNKKVSIQLSLLQLKRHFIYDVVRLLQLILEDLEV
ncbi:MAG: transcription-repair coupling factor [Bacilli bacterium]|nr:transcription-repair coupling factor [Bacilli bacterium]